MRDGGWFPAVVPTLTYEQRVGVNVGMIPSYKDRLYGGISVKLKLKVKVLNVRMRAGAPWPGAPNTAFANRRTMVAHRRPRVYNSDRVI
jgi:hypothetical protein